MTARLRTNRGVALLAALIAVWAVLLGGQPASGLTPVTAETRVRASVSSFRDAVGLPDRVPAGQYRGEASTYGSTVVATGVAPNTADEAALLSQANALRDGKLAELAAGSARGRSENSVVVGAYSVRTGNTAWGVSSKTLQECAEACAARNVGGDLVDIRLRSQMRPRGGGRPATVNRSVPPSASRLTVAALSPTGQRSSSPI